ncbi:Tetratricopeptide repeat-containing protein [Amycolatopsis tolypomycina]|uniref:Tetratricopeptide repeat-containing protein n=1 Tax=Amycolatopsis tolypomycina TaxID=208445 RepID=A0A1H4TUW8_9PSEU|nr:tetratricopeptide repeat protein [Amycolatopsis tolypomycina]SEC60207.1 Tetratricopeptide repeat-containing protein [Amycolatopsis tolypomycina]
MDPADRNADKTVPVPMDGTRSELSGTAGDVVQARDVSGGVHFHQFGTNRRDVPRQLLGDVRGFVNRSAELGRLDTVLSERGHEAAHLTVIVGTAGVGKTALALRWAHRRQDHFPDGQLYVNLRGYDPGTPITAEQALDRFLRALDVPSARIPADPEAKAALYRSLLAGLRALVVLDNAESVGQVRPLIPGSDDCRVIVTSRSRLAGLMARDGAQRVIVEVLPESESVELISAITADYRTQDDPADLAELARLCACLPLALRIAAERAATRPWMPLAQLIQDLRDESGLWDALSAEDGEEADGVRAVFAWSYRALPADAARMFRLLGLHPGPEFSVEAAAELAGVTVLDSRRLLDTLCGAHLIEQIASDRYEFHDLLRAYATNAAHHEESLEEQYAALSRVLSWYLHTAHTAGIAMRTPVRLLPPTALPAPSATLGFAEYLDGARWYELEWANLLAAVQAAEKSGLDRVSWQLGLMLRPLFTRQAPIADRLQVLETALGAARRDDDKLAEAEASFALGAAFSTQHRLDEALRVHSEVLRLQREIGDSEGELLSVNMLGVLFLMRRSFAEAVEQLESARGLSRERGDAGREATALFNLADAYDGLGRYREAIDAARASLALSRELDDQRRELVALVYLARALADSGENGREEALRLAETALNLARARTDDRNEGWVLLDYARIQRLNGHSNDALVSYQRATTLHRALEDRAREAAALDGAGQAYQDLGRTADAIPFHRRAVVIFRELDDRWRLAVALDNLATALRTTDVAEARSCWQEAAELFDGYVDPSARAHLTRIVRLLG